MDKIHNSLQILDYVVVFIYIIALVSLGYWVSFVKKKKKNENLFLAGHSLKWYSIGLNMWGTNVGPSMLIASAASGFSVGIAGANFSWFGFLFIMALAMVFAPFYRTTKVSTLPEFIGKRYSERTRELLAWYSLITILLSWLGITLYTGGLLVSQILGWPLWISMTSLTTLAAFFAIAGGLEAIAITNIFQMVLLIIVSLGLTITGIIKVGGITNVYEAVPAKFWILFRPNSDLNYPWLPIVLGYPVMAIWFYCTDQSMVQSVLAAKNLKQGQLGVNMNGWLKIIDMPLFILPGIICFILFPDLASPEEAYATMVMNLMPVGIIGLVMAVLIAALVSTIDSALNSVSTIFTLDIFVRRFKPYASQKEIIRIGRIVALIAAVFGVFIGLGISSIQIDDLYIMLQSILAFLAPPMSVVFLIGILWKRATPAAANLVLSLGSVISIGIGVCSLWNIPSKEFWPHPLLLSFFVFVGLMALAILVSLATMKNYQGSSLPPLKQILSKNGSSRSIWFLWVALGILTIALYIFFN